MTHDQTDSHLAEWAELVGDEVPECVRRGEDCLAEWRESSSWKDLV